MALMPGSRRFLNPASAAWLRGLQERIAAATGPMTASERLSSLVIPAAIRYTNFKLRHGIGQQPGFTRRTFRMDPAAQGHLAPLPRIAFNPGG